MLPHDSRERQKALDTSQSFIVEAPAGSGKTELLIQRFLKLLVTVKKPEEILAITFTKKAANEMRARLIKALSDAHFEVPTHSPHESLTRSLAKAVLDKDREENWYLINNPNQLRILTIDAFCHYLVKQMPLLSQFGSTPLISENPAQLYREAAEETLRHLENKSALTNQVAKLLKHLDNDYQKLQQLIMNLLGQRDQWLSYLRFNEEDRIFLESQLQKIISAHLQYTKMIFPKLLTSELILLANHAAHILKSKNTFSELSILTEINQLPGINIKSYPFWRAISSFVLTHEGEVRKSVDARLGFLAPTQFKNPDEKKMHADLKARMIQMLTNLSEYPEVKEALFNIKKLPYAHYPDYEWDILAALFSVLKIAVATLKVIFQKQAKIDFIENAEGALLALYQDETPTDLLLHLDYQIKHLLVDEFQDTAYLQYSLLEKLTAGWINEDDRTLFVVGDPMQSIYRFRQAEVGLFMRMAKYGINQLSLMPLKLSQNFRSNAHIVNWNNDCFSAIFPKTDDMKCGAVSYRKSSPQHEMAAYSHITIKAILTQQDSIQASYLIQYIKETLTQFPNDSIAVLTRSRSHLKALLPLLKTYQIPYHAINIDNLSNRQSIQDLLSLTLALHHLDDRLAWIAILRAPWCGLTLHDLYLLAENREALIWQQLNDKNVIHHLSHDGQSRIKKIMVTLTEKIHEFQRENLRTYIESTWLLLGGPATLNDLEELHDVEAFFNLLTELDTAPYLNREILLEQIEKLYADVHHQESRLQIMTIHSAKGLEFDTVIIPHLEKKMLPDDKTLFNFMECPITERENALLLAPIQAVGKEDDATYQYIQYQNQLKAQHEVDRLFYVATTRAKKRLCLSFQIEQNENNQYRVEKNSFLAKIWPNISASLSQYLIHPDPSLAEENPKNIKKLNRFVPTWHNPMRAILLEDAHNEEKTLGFNIKNNTAKIIGTIIHKILENIGILEITWWTNRNEKEQNIYLENQLEQHYFLSREHSNIIKFIKDTITKTLNDPRGQWILSAHQDAKSEYAITTLIQGKAQQYIIDRTFIAENGIRYIIDYKTSTLTDVDFQQFLAEEYEKYTAKMHYYAQAFYQLEKRPIQLALYFPALSAFKEWQAYKETNYQELIKNKQAV